MPQVARATRVKVARVLLRLPADLHQSLVKAAAARQLSVNEFCVRCLQAPASAENTSVLRALVVERARALFGDGLAGVLLLGSWARGDAATSSDIDALVVIDPRTPLTRDLYRQWDAAPLAFEGRVIDAHFAHLPEAGTAPTAVWCEAAIDGLLWFDRDGALAARLAEARRAIADGLVVRAVAHGQPYWKGGA